MVEPMAERLWDEEMLERKRVVSECHVRECHSSKLCRLLVGG